MLGRMMLSGGAIAPALLVEQSASQVSSWTPGASGLAFPGDLAVIVGQGISGSGWTTLGPLKYRFLSSGDMATSFAAPGAYYEFVFVVLRRVRSVVQRVHDSALSNTTIPGFAKSDYHAGLLIHTEIDPASILAGSHVNLNSLAGPSIPSTVRYYSPLAGGGNSTRNLHAYLAADFPTYPNNAPFNVGDSATYSTDFYAFELIGG